LHILAGDVGLQSDITGDIRYNAKNVDPKKPLWQRCALIEAHDEQYADLTVKEVITFAMKLRCQTKKGFAQVEENVKLTVEILHLDEILTKKVISLSRGERRRLSIAEEIVHGPSLVLIDEPCTHLDLLDESVMMMTFREMVNQDKTVITTSYQPSSASFKLFDDVILLSKGRVIYSGPTAAAEKFFISSPWNYDITGYGNNLGDFLIDISTSQLADATGNRVEATALESYFQESETYRNLIARLNRNASPNLGPTPPTRAVTPTASRIGISPTAIVMESNPMAYTRDSSASSSRKESFDVESSINATINSASSDVPSTFAVVVTVLVSIFACYPQDFDMSRSKAGTILHRSALGLWNRWQLTTGSLLVYILLACIFGWILGDTSDQIYNSSSFFAVAPLLLFIMNVLFIFYVFKSNQVGILKAMIALCFSSSELFSGSLGLLKGAVTWLVLEYPALDGGFYPSLHPTDRQFHHLCAHLL
jgi:ABC-type multidrug transport system ATPase subunit